MDYLAIARAAALRYERNETHERSPGRLPAREAGRLKARIIEAVTVEPHRFDRAEYERLWAHWEAHEAAGEAP